MSGSGRAVRGSLLDHCPVPGSVSVMSTAPNHGSSGRQRGVWCIVVAGGSGTRFGRPKQYLDLAGERVIDRAVATATGVCDGVVLVVPRADVDSERALRSQDPTVDALVVAGGVTRAESVRRGLAVVPEDAGIILVHDAARPLAGLDLYRRVIEAVLGGADSVVPVIRPVDTLRLLNGTIVDRETMRAVQTPQGFPAHVLREAHSGGGEATDDAALVQEAGYEVTFVEGDRSNLKITEPVDLVIARALIEPEQG